MKAEKANNGGYKVSLIEITMMGRRETLRQTLALSGACDRADISWLIRQRLKPQLLLNFLAVN